MSGKQEIRRRKPGFGKRGEVAKSAPKSVWSGHVTQIWRHVWGEKQLQRRTVKKGFGFK